MNALVGLVVVPVRNSLILIGSTFRTFSAVVSKRRGPEPGFVHDALATRSPLNGFGPEVTVKTALTVSPGATEPNVAESLRVPATTALQCRSGPATRNFTSTAGDPVVFVNVTVVFCEDPGVNVCSPGGVAVAEAGARLSRWTSYLAATTLAWTALSVVSVGYAAVITPS